MKQFKKFYKVFVIALVLSMVSPSVLPISTVAVVQAASIKLSKTKLSLEVGKTKQLTITGTEKAVTWTTSKKSVATVSKAGKVTAKKAGTAVITATVNKKKYTCKVTVKAAVAANPYVTDAPFKAQEETFANISYVIPKGWTKDVLAKEGNNIMYSIHSSDVDETTVYSSVNLTLTETGETKPDYSLVKETFAGIITEEYLTSQFTATDPTATITDFKTSDYTAKLGTAFKTEYKVTYMGVTMTQVIYDLYIDNYLVEVTATDIADGITPNVKTVCEYLLNSIQTTK